MICAIILAAGRSRRMGTQKLLLPLAGRTVIRHIVEQVGSGGVERTIVVLGRDAVAVAEALSGLFVTLVTNPDPHGEMLGSVRCGIRVLPAACKAVLVALGDQPGITSDLVRRMIDAYRTAGRGILVPVYQGRRGHPILFSADYCEQILTEFDGVGLRGLPEAHAGDVVELPVPTASVVSDMDRPEDYRRELDRLAGEGGGSSC